MTRATVLVPDEHPGIPPAPAGDVPVIYRDRIIGRLLGINVIGLNLELDLELDDDVELGP